MGQNPLSQSNYRVCKSAISLEQNDEKAWFFACWYKLMESRSWLKSIGVGIIKNGWSHSVLSTLKFAVCQGKMNEVNWFLVCWYKFIKAKSYFNHILVVVVKNGHGLLDFRTLKSAVLQRLIKCADFLYADTNLGKLKVTLTIIS